MLRLERVLPRVLDGIDGEVDIEIGPIQMIFAWPLELEHRFDRCIHEPGELIKGHEKLAVVDQQPDAVMKIVNYYSI